MNTEKMEVSDRYPCPLHSPKQTSHYAVSCPAASLKFYTGLFFVWCGKIDKRAVNMLVLGKRLSDALAIESAYFHLFVYLVTREQRGEREKYKGRNNNASRVPPSSPSEAMPIKCQSPFLSLFDSFISQL